MSNFSRTTRSKPLRCVSLTLKDLEAIARIVEDKNALAKHSELSAIRLSNLDEDAKKNVLSLVDQNQRMTIFINGADGDTLVSSDPSVFQSHNLPLNISFVTIETQTHRKISTNTEPLNHIRISARLL